MEVGVAEPAERPTFTGLIVYRNLEYRFSFLYPEDWYRFDLPAEEGHAVAFAPSPDGLTTSFSVEARDLGMTVTEADLPELRRGWRAGLRRLPLVTLEQLEDYAIGSLVGLEARYTFRDGEAVRKRWVRLLYQGSTQVLLVAQGATAEVFDYWMPMFTQCMRTFKFGDWWAEVLGKEWLPSLQAPPDDAQDLAPET
jgi:hypothetical protein